MEQLIAYIIAHSIRGGCSCGQCFDSKTATNLPPIPSSHTADLVFFKITLNQDTPPNSQTLLKLIRSNQQGIDGNLDPFDQMPHGYMEVAAWLGDQALAMRLMGMGALLNIWKLITPYTLHPNMSHKEALESASNGFVLIHFIEDGHGPNKSDRDIILI